MKRLLACVVLLGLLHWPGKAKPRPAASEGKQKDAASQPAAAPDVSEFVGAETCETCHGDLAKRFDISPHSHLALMHGGKGVTCESCHGAGKAHVEKAAAT